MLELRELTKSYPTRHGRRYVFRDLSFTFPPGANIGLIGRNGAGKSTLLRLLGGIDTPDRGEVRTDARISFPVALGGGFLPALTARENVSFVARIHGFHGQDLRRLVHYVQDFAEIGDYFDLPMESYSSGMRSRVTFGMSMAFDFDYYLIDEVMAVGDAQFKAKSKAVLLERLARANVILTSHNMSDIRQFCNVVVHVDAGHVQVYEDVDAGIRAYHGNLVKT
ncbi:MAG: ABC transporter ATP-binding protein [Burkholderiaceae bacterium]|nr:ABC transporter ATP-binding protein [Burkholderiaceae bacterium]